MSMQAMEPIAITGMACRFPGAPSLEAFWTLLSEGRDGVVAIPPERWDVDAYHDADPKAPGRTTARTGGFLDDVAGFDAAYFGISPREAAQMDPQQRILLELSCDALEDAGIAPAALAGSDTAVFVGAMTNDYFRLQLGDGYRRVDTHTGSGGGLGMLANRVSYQFDLRGPSITVDTACSSSLVAVLQACQSLWSGQSRLALAAGVNVILDPSINVFYTKAGLAAADGRCKTFSASADGIGRAEGAGVVVLKPLSRAQADGDRIHAVIRGGAINHDGRSNGMTQPNRWAQEALLRSAYAHAGVSGRDLQYIELHGTGTLIGDPIEANALASVLTEDGERPVCLVGSVKTNFGHLEAAAGIAGLIKLALGTSRGQIPPSLWFDAPNPHIPFDRIPLRVNTSLSPWDAVDGRRIGGVSSFGLGGANAHVVVESAPAQPASPPSPAGLAHALLLSARSERALREVAARHADALASQPGLDLADVCASAIARRCVHDLRAVAVAHDRADLVAALRAIAAGDTHRDVVSARVRTSRHGLVVVLPVLASIPATAVAALLATAAAAAAWERSRHAFAAAGIVLPAIDAIATNDDFAGVTADDPAFAAWHFALQYALLAPMIEDIVAGAGALVADGIGQLAALAALDAVPLDDIPAWLAGRHPAQSHVHYAAHCLFAAGEDPDIAAIDPSAHGDLSSRLAAREDIADADIVVLGDATLAIADGQGERLHPLADAAGWARMFAKLATTHTLRWSRWAPAGQFVRLPAYPWQRERHWLPGLAAGTSGIDTGVVAAPRRDGAAGLIGDALDQPEKAWRYVLDGDTVPYLPDHLVQGAVLLPGAGYVEIGLAVQAALDGHQPAVLQDLSFRQALMVEPGQSATVHVTGDARRREFSVHSRKDGDADWTLHALGRIGSAGVDDADATVDLAALRQRCTRYTAGDDHYANMRLRGFGYGPAFQGVRGLWLEDGGERVLARIERPQAIAGDRGNERLHPALFDASLQSILTTLTARGDNDLYIPTGIDRLVLHRPTGDAFWCHGGLQHAGNGLIRGDIVLFDDDGRLIASAQGVRAQALTRKERDDLRGLDDWLYAWRWQPAADRALRKGGRWLLVHGDALPADALAQAMREAGAADVRTLSVDALAIDTAGLPVDVDPAQIDGVVFGGLLDVTDAPVEGHAFAPLLALLRLFGGAERAIRLPCVVLTRDAQCVPGHDDSADAMRGLGQTPLVGLARVAANEFPSLHVRLVDIAAGDEASASLAAEVLADDDEEEIALRGDHRHVHRMERTTAADAKREAPPAEATALSGTAAYLITGGFGGFGLEAADWLVAQGVRRLALVGRRGASTPEVHARLDAMRAEGATVLEIAADMADEAQVVALLARIRGELGPIEGVFHAAAALDDAVIAQLAPAQIDIAMAAKCRGAWFLHRHTAADPLRHFVLFSSISAMVGGTGQASYAMACSFLDGLARSRRARGLVATSLNWGALRDVGMATRYGDVERLLGSTGLGLFTPAQAVKLLALATRWQPVELGIAQMDWGQWARTYPTWGESPKYRGLLASAPAAPAAGVGTGSGALRAQLLAASPEAREAEIADRFAQLLAETLGASAGTIDRGLPLPSLGLDSMMALDLLAALDAAFGVKVPMLMVMKGNSIEQLAPLVAAMVVESAASQAAPADAPGMRSRELPEELDLESVERFIAGLGELEDGEIERLLQRVMLEEDATP